MINEENYELKELFRKNINQLMRESCLTCRYCMYAESIDDHEDGYKCNHFSHNKKYAVMSGDYCSKFVSKDNENKE